MEPTDPRQPTDPQGDLRRQQAATSASIRKAGPYVDASWQFIASMVLLSLGGRWADGRFGTSPWLTVVGALGGFGIGLYTFLRVILHAERKAKASREAGTTDGDESAK